MMENENDPLDYNALLPDGYLPTAEQLNIRVDGFPLRVVRYSHCDVPFYLVHATLRKEEEHEVELSVKRHHGIINVLPRRHEIDVRPQQGKQPGRCLMNGLSDEFGIQQVRLENVTVAGQPLRLDDIERNEFVRDLSVEPG